MTLLLLIIGSLYLLAGGVLAVSLLIAPVGFEDRNGFHLGSRPGRDLSGDGIAE